MQKSDCCNSTWKVSSADECTNCYICDKCGKACDVHEELSCENCEHFVNTERGNCEGCKDFSKFVLWKGAQTVRKADKGEIK